MTDPSDHPRAAAGAALSEDLTTGVMSAAAGCRRVTQPVCLEIHVKRFVAGLALCFLVTACGSTSDTGSGKSGTTAKDAYPQKGKTIQMVVGYTAGGATDIWARILTDELSKETGAKFQVVNKPGAGGQIGLNSLLSSPKDGSVIASVNLPSALAYLYPNSKTTYKRDDFSLVAASGYSPNVIAVRKDSKYNSLQDLLNDAKAQPGKLNAAADGPLSDDTVAYTYLQQKTGIKFNIVVVDGSADKVTALLGKQVDFFGGSLTGVLPQVKSGQFKLLAVYAEKRSPFLPDVPTAKEQGVDVLSDNRWNVTLAKGAPDDVRQGLEDAIKKVTESKTFQDRTAQAGIEVQFKTGTELSDVWKQQEDIIRQVVATLK
jgi:tripartite-type tricarboxylate transporter receptor subunit TctC